MLGGGGRVREERELVVYHKVWECFFFAYFVLCNGPCAPKEKWHRKEHISNSSSMYSMFFIMGVAELH